jgi:hypothetical protein
MPTEGAVHSDSIGGASRRKNPAKGKSAITNGKLLLAAVDGRSLWARRFRDLCILHTNDLGGADMVSESEKMLIRRCATLNCELEMLEQRFAEDGQSDLASLETYQRAANSLRRLLQALGLQRRSKDITLSLAEYLQQRDRRQAQQQEVQEPDGAAG